MPQRQLELVAIAGLVLVLAWCLLGRAGQLPAPSGAWAHDPGTAASSSLAIAGALALDEALGVGRIELEGADTGAVAADLAARMAITRVGTPYVWGGQTPRQGFDCSGLVRWAYRQAGVNLPRTTWSMWGAETRVPYRALRRGDVIFVNARSHEGMYLGNGRWVVASSSRGVVVEAAPPRSRFAGAIRPAGTWS